MAPRSRKSLICIFISLPTNGPEPREPKVDWQPNQLSKHLPTDNIEKFSVLVDLSSVT
jgi:hypothetical protein